MYFIEIISFNAGENRKSIPKIHWYEEDYARILMRTGLDRGYTVEGLTVSYLESSTQLDTTLRARFLVTKNVILNTLNFLAKTISKLFY